MSITLTKAANKDIETISCLLNENNLPYQDINVNTMELFLAENDSDFIGIIGLECFDKTGLLRSMVVKEKYRNKGYGKELCKKILKFAIEKEIEEIFVLTCSAKIFFENIGFRKINRETAPDNIKNTIQFSSLCPQSAICLRIIVRQNKVAKVL